ncbi:DUF922 domain-containing protein [Coralliovum pocilloporae]|uniref:DUF922 domain-containing protein n=1 Tax=Coralliovum pocilloporae TaxID=3066369 RepID=UPI0033077AB0
MLWTGWGNRVGRITALAAGFLVIGNMAYADVETKTEIKHYTIRGKSAADIVSNMDQRGPIVDGSHALASIEQDFSLKGRLVKTDRCRIKGFGVVTKFEITLPKLRTTNGVPARTLKNFKRFYKKAESHELTHRKIYLGCAKRIDQKVRALRPSKTCSVLEDKVSAIIKKEAQRCEAQHFAFDQKESRRVSRLALMRQALKEFRNPPKREIVLTDLDRLMIERSSGR